MPRGRLIRVSDETYRRLLKLKHEMEDDFNRLVPMREVMECLVEATPLAMYAGVKAESKRLET